jgi:Ni2+-binding GTPase involved in maturation of urease and hydrogenase
MTETHAAPIRLILLGGFLGAGKTTTLLKLAQHWVGAGRRVGIITNDQAADLVDSEIFRSAGLDALEVAGGCFCCHFDDFIGRADELISSARPHIIMGEPVGSCTDLVATVLNPLKRLYPARFLVAPFTVLVDPVRALRVLGRSQRVGLSERITYIYRMQQQEADAIAISKIDLLAASERDRIERLVREQFPGRDVFGFSARTGEGFDTLISWLGSDSGRGRALHDLDYDVYAEGEAELGWLNRRVQLEDREAIALDHSLLLLGREIHDACRARGLEIAHGKLLLNGGGHVAVVNMVDSRVSPELSGSSGASAGTLELTVNLRVQAEPAVLEEIVHASLVPWAERHGVVIVAGSGQCFKPPRPVPTHRVAEQELLGRHVDSSDGPRLISGHSA